MKKKCTSLVYIPELTPEDVFSHMVCRHADQVRARNAQKAYELRKKRERKCIAAILIVACAIATAAWYAISRGAGLL